MTEREQREWLELLGPTREAQMSVLAELLRNAANDGMSEADRRICTRQMQRLAGEAGIDLTQTYRSNFRRKRRYADRVSA